MYTIDRRIPDAELGAVADRVRRALAAQGFGVLTEIDVRQTLKSKIGADIPGYVIFGACNPAMAYEALQLEPRVGAMLPCNVIIRELGGGAVEVSAIDPVASMSAIENDRLKAVAARVRDMLAAAVAAV